MRRVHLSILTEGIKAFSKRIRRCSVDGRKRYENDECGRKSLLNRAKQLRFRLKPDYFGGGLNVSRGYFFKANFYLQDEQTLTLLTVLIFKLTFTFTLYLLLTLLILTLLKYKNGDTFDDELKSRVIYMVLPM